MRATMRKNLMKVFETGREGRREVRSAKMPWRCVGRWVMRAEGKPGTGGEGECGLDFLCWGGGMWEGRG